MSYTELRKGLANPGEKILTSEGPAIVIDNNVLLESVKVRLILNENLDKKELDLSDDIYVFHKNEIKRISKSNNEGKNKDTE